MSSEKLMDGQGNFFWVKPGTTIFHREDGPAVEYDNGTRNWFIDGKLHRLDGPAAEYPDGKYAWYKDGKCHREDGPAIENDNGTKLWYYENEYIDCNSQEEFERIIKLKAFW